MRTTFSLKNRLNDGLIEAGCDEAGRGPLAGAVFAAAVILPYDFFHPLLNDSKKMSRKAREELRPIIEQEAVSFAVEMVSPEEIDSINILNASIAGMWRSVMRLDTVPEFLLIDGNRFKPYSLIPHSKDSQNFNDTRPPWSCLEIVRNYDSIPYRCIVKGDATFASIAAASVLAKTYRDEYMERISKEYPMYRWDKNMGYPTKEHIEAVRKYGYSPYHRKSFHVKELEPTLF